MSVSFPQLFHTVSYQLFPKKHIQIDQYNGIQESLFDEAYIRSIVDMTFFKAPSFYKKEFSRVAEYNHYEYHDELDSIFKNTTSKKMEIDYSLSFEPGANWSVKVNLRNAVKTFDVKYNKKLVNAVKSIQQTNGPIMSDHTTIFYDEDNNRVHGRTNLYTNYVSRSTQDDNSENIYIDIVPTLDDYSSVLKRLRSQIELTEHFCKGKNTYILLIRDFESKNISFETVESIFEKANIVLIRIDELDQFYFKTD
jgi:hypothetical protein